MLCGNTLIVALSLYRIGSFPKRPEEKADQLSVWEIWGGISGLQTGMQVMYGTEVRQGKISLNTFAAIMR